MPNMPEPSTEAARAERMEKIIEKLKLDPEWAPAMRAVLETAGRGKAGKKAICATVRHIAMELGMRQLVTDVTGWSMVAAYSYRGPEGEPANTGDCESGLTASETVAAAESNAGGS